MFQGHYQSARICLTSRGVEIEEMQSQVLIIIFDNACSYLGYACH